ncbi:MAG TPA: TolC family protein [Verrucomicrobiota bacterium]|nr:TolC family protein [Verrucomicrobiota bacterium]
MKQRIETTIMRSLACSLAISGGCFLGFAAQPSDLPVLPSSVSSATNVLTLEEAVRLALENNPELRASRGRIDAAAGRAYQSKLWTNPELIFSAEDWPVSGGGDFSDAKQTIGAAQTIPFPGKKNLDRHIGISGVRLSEAELDLRRVERVRDVKSTFYQVLAAERLVEVAGELVNVAESSAATARKRVAAGAAPDQEQLRAEIPLEQARIELSGFQQELTTARQTLALLLGRPDLTEVPVAGALRETADLGLLEQGPDQWLPNHPSVLAVKTNRDRAELELRRARLEPYPDVRMGLAGGRIGETGQSILQLELSVPLPIIDRSKGKKQEAQANVRIAEADQVAVEQRLLREWGTASKRFRTAVEQVTNYRDRILPKVNEALRLVQTGFEQGKFGFMDLLDTQRTTAEARLTYQQKLLELNVAQAELEFLALGAIQSEPKKIKP